MNDPVNVSIDVDTDQIWQHYNGSLALVLSVNETNFCLKENQSIEIPIFGVTVTALSDIRPGKTVFYVCNNKYWLCSYENFTERLPDGKLRYCFIKNVLQ